VSGFYIHCVRVGCFEERGCAVMECGGRCVLSLLGGNRGCTAVGNATRLIRDVFGL